MSLILQPFIENAFKHGTGKEISSPWIKILLNLNDRDELCFSIENSRPATPDEDRIENANGIGLKNVKERLNIIYPGSHTLEITDREKYFRVVLTIKLNKKS